MKKVSFADQQEGRSSSSRRIEVDYERVTPIEYLFAVEFQNFPPLTNSKIKNFFKKFGKVELLEYDEH